jgi:dipeptidyl aminopeptidase/acylaminoacyl peptidase
MILPLLLLVSGAADAPTFTIDDLLAAPFPSDLVAAPVGSRLAWVQNDRGVRNVFVAEGDLGATAKTTFDADDGQELQDLAWSPDGAVLAFTRGGPANGKGDSANPAALADPQEQDVYLLRLPEGPARKIGPGHAPVLSSKGLLAYVSKRDCYGAPLDGGNPALLFHTGGQVRSLRFSPDGSRLAFVSDRGDHSFVGVFDVATRGILYLDPSLERDEEPAWSPDGARVAFLRQPPSSRQVLFMSKRTAEPWSIRVADATSGRGKEVFRSETGTGSRFFGLPTENQILWADGDRLVFPWEKTGFLGLYSVPAAGGAPAVPLVTGAFEVEQVVLAPDRKTLYWSSNEGDVDRRHLFSLSLPSGKRAQRTSGTGIEWAPAPTGDGGALAYLASDARTPAHAVSSVGGKEAKALAKPPAFAWEKSLVAPEPVLFSAADGVTIHGQVFRPRTLPPGGRAPAVLFFHGGPRRQMLLGFHYREYYHNAYAMNEYLASRGFLVLSVNYRSGIGYGMEFREAANFGRGGASEFADVLGAGLYLRSRSDVDPSRIGLWGGSYGGYLTALGLSRASDLFAAGVDFHGVHDWNLELPVFNPSYEPEKDRDAARIAYESSPVSSLGGWRSPVLFVHGDDDRNVPFSESVTVAEILRQKGVSVEDLVLPDEIHEFLLHRSWVRAYGAAAEFLERHLKERR